MRLHLVSANSDNVGGMEYFINKAFLSLGWDVICTDYRVMSKELVDTRIKYVTDADFLLCVKGERINPESLYSCRIPKILWLQDSVRANREARFILETKAWAYNLVYTFDVAEIPLYKSVDIDAAWLPLAADEDYHKQIGTEKVYDTGFIGTLTESRVRTLRGLLEAGIPVNYFYDKDNYVDIINKTLINLNIGIIESGYQQRVFEALSMGAFLISNDFQGTKLFDDKKDLVYFKTHGNLVSLIKYYLEHKDEAMEIARCGKEKALSAHTYKHRVERIISDAKRYLQ